MLLCQRRKRADIVRFHHPARRALHIEQPGAEQCLGNSFFIAAIDIGHLDLHPLQHRAEQAECIGIDMLDRDDTVTRLDEGEHRRRDRRHAAGKTERVLGTLELRQHLLEHPDRRIEAAGIDRAHLFTAIGGNHVVVIGEGEQRRLEDRRHHGLGEISFVVRGDEGCELERV